MCARFLVFATGYHYRLSCLFVIVDSRRILMIRTWIFVKILGC